MTKVLGMHHAALAATDLEAAVTFYRDVAGLEPGVTPEASNPLQWMYAGEIPVLHIFEPRAGRNAPADNAYGVAHLALTIEDFDVAKARLEDHGVDHQTNIMESQSARQLFFDGPDGVRIELIEFGKV